MQFSERWLRSMVDPQITSDDLSHLLTMSGSEVESIEPVALPFTNTVVGLIVHTSKHPNANRLILCQVDVGTGTMLNIICGAPNARVGLKVPCAMVGASLPLDNNGKIFKIKLAKLRGVESQGMLCSAYDLRLSEEKSGLLELSKDAPVGQNFRDYFGLNDLKFTVNLTPNRSDCLSVLGVAREVSILTSSVLKEPIFDIFSANIAEILPVKISAADLCGRFSGRVVRNLNTKVSTPQWIKHRLERSGQRSTSAFVDISNYVMLEMGLPTHIFDLDKIQGGLDVRWGKTGESLNLINGCTISVDDWIGVIADDIQIESVAGIMGGNRTSVSAETKNIFLEAAFWQPQAIQGRARRLNISTDSCHRFERGVDFSKTVDCIERITSLLIEICGTPDTKIGPIDDQIVDLPKRNPVKVRISRIAKLIGIPFSEDQIANIFTRLGMIFQWDNGVFSVTPPPHRFDIEIEEDLIAEVTRIYGFENIPASLPASVNKMHISPENERSLPQIRHQLVNLDYQEMINFSFVQEAWETDFTSNVHLIKLLNPISSQMSVMRSSLVAGLVANVKYNVNRNINRVRIFEIGPVYIRNQETQSGPLTIAGFDQPKKITALSYGMQVDEQWGQESRVTDFFDMKSDLEALFSPVTLYFRKIEHPALNPGCSAQVLVNEKPIGFIGELHPYLQEKYDLPLPPVIFEVDSLAPQQQKKSHYVKFSKFPSVSRDLSIIVKQSVFAQELLDNFIFEQKNNPICRVLKSIILFDQYHGKGLESNEKNLAFRFTLQDDTSTLQDSTVNSVMSTLISAIARVPTARLRV